MAQEQRKVTFRFLSLRRKGSMCAYHRDSKGFLRCQYADGALQDHGKKRTSNLSGSQPLRIGGVFFSFFFFFFCPGIRCGILVPVISSTTASRTEMVKGSGISPCIPGPRPRSMLSCYEQGLFYSSSTGSVLPNGILENMSFRKPLCHFVSHL